LVRVSTSVFNDNSTSWASLPAIIISSTYDNANVLAYSLHWSIDHYNVTWAMIGLFLYPCGTHLNWSCLLSYVNVVSFLHFSSSGIVKNMSKRPMVENHVYAQACSLLNNSTTSVRLPGIWGVSSLIFL
jgi:hypothetical protein